MSKYGNKQAVASDGRIFPSKRECKRYEDLLLLVRMKKIWKLECQVKYVLIPKQKVKGFTERPVTYTADFQYVDRETGETHVEDSKGMKTQQYVIRRKLMLWFHEIHVEEV